jgi:integrase
MGTIYKRGQTYWIKYYQKGRPFYESAKTDKKMVAKKLLDQREGEIAQGRIPGISFDRVKFDGLAEDLLTDYRINQRKSLERAVVSVGHLKVFFRGFQVPEVNTAAIKKYIGTRLETGAANATINRELSALKRMLNLGADCTPPKVDRVPKIPMLKENNVRKGFFEHAQFLALRDSLPEFLRGVATFGYKVGWRMSEILELKWSQVDLEQGIVCLNPGETKNDEARTVYLDDELKIVFRQLWRHRKESGKLSPYVFPNEDGTDRIRDFRRSWGTACKNAKIGKRIFHDFRRTAIRNMVRAGIPEAVAMKISGHRTRSVFERYNIVSDEDLKVAAAKQEAYLKERNEVVVTKTVTYAEFPRKKDSTGQSATP